MTDRILCRRDPYCYLTGGLCDDVRECGNAYPAPDDRSVANRDGRWDTWGGDGVGP